MSTNARNLVINSRNRTIGGTNTRFQVQPYPRVGTLTSAELIYCSTPFSFKNVTERYGNKLFIKLTPSLFFPVFYTMVIDIPQYFYTMPQLIQWINLEIARQITVHGIGITLNITISDKNHHLQIDGTPLDMQVEFIFDLAGSSTVLLPGKRYIYTMLGLPIDSISTFIFSGTPHIFPYSFTEDIPFRYLLISLDTFPTGVSTTGDLIATFFVDISDYRPIITVSPTEIIINKTIVYYSRNTYQQKIDLYHSPKTLQWIGVSLTDENGYDITEHAQQRDWVFAMHIDVAV